MINFLLAVLPAAALALMGPRHHPLMRRDIAKDAGNPKRRVEAAWAVEKKDAGAAVKNNAEAAATKNFDASIKVITSDISDKTTDKGDAKTVEETAEQPVPSPKDNPHDTNTLKDSAEGMMTRKKLMRHENPHCEAPEGSLPRGTSEDSLAATWSAMKIGNIAAQKSAPLLDDSHLSKEIGSSNNWLVFTSAGDASHVSTWRSGGKPLFDVFAAYYGKQGEKGLGSLRNYTTLAWSNKGSKFQNLFWAMTSPKTKNSFEQYSAVLACDDDIDLDVPKVHALFQAHKTHDMTMLGPSFEAAGRTSWRSGTHVANSFMRYGAFVEVTCPLFTMKALKDFMLTVYHPSLLGWGVDYMYIHYFNFAANPRRWGVLDAVTVFNGLTHKNGIRDIEKLASNDARARAFEVYRSKYKLSSDNITCWSHLIPQWQSTANYSCGRILMSRSVPGQSGEYTSEGCEQQLPGKKAMAG